MVVSWHELMYMSMYVLSEILKSQIHIRIGLILQVEKDLYSTRSKNQKKISFPIIFAGELNFSEYSFTNRVLRVPKIPV